MTQDKGIMNMWRFEGHMKSGAIKNLSGIVRAATINDAVTQVNFEIPDLMIDSIEGAN